jgi:hypothetical protein
MKIRKFKHVYRSDFEIGIVYCLRALHIHLGYYEFSIDFNERNIK